MAGKVKILPKSQEHVILDMIKTGKQNALYKEGNFSNQIIWQDITYIFHAERKTNILKDGLFIFSMVKRDVLKFMDRVEQIENKKSYPTNFVIEESAEDKRRITGTDLNHAYWRIAYNLGYISKNTYEKGLTVRNKALRLAALSSLGRDKEFVKIQNGKITNKLKVVKGDNRLRVIYNNIRNTCFYHMHEAAQILGSDFVAYKTDCIYYYDKPENRKKIATYLKNQSLGYKQLPTEAVSN